MEWNIRADRPVYLQLLEQLEAAVASGAYAPGERLPGVRELAAQAGVNPRCSPWWALPASIWRW